MKKQISLPLVLTATILLFAPHLARAQMIKTIDADQRDEAFAEEKHKEEVASIRKQNCETARKNLANLRRGGNNAYMTPEGEVVRLTDDERAKRIEDAKQGIKDNCEG